LGSRFFSGLACSSFVNVGVDIMIEVLQHGSYCPESHFQ
jgi:hypothetical protein